MPGCKEAMGTKGGDSSQQQEPETPLQVSEILVSRQNLPHAPSSPSQEAATLPSQWFNHVHPKHPAAGIYHPSLNYCRYLSLAPASMLGLCAIYPHT